MPNEIRVLGIVGSPREGGNTDTLVAETLRAAEEAGARTKKLFIGKYKIAPCTSCGACVKTGQCFQRDGMDELVPLMEEHQIWVLGTPVYWWGATAQMKASTSSPSRRTPRSRLAWRRTAPQPTRGGMNRRNAPSTGSSAGTSSG